MISMTPLHRHSTPAMETLSSTAEAAPSMAASATASSRPVMRPNTRDSTTIPVQIQVIAMVIPPLRRRRGGPRFLQNCKFFFISSFELTKCDGL